MMGKGDPEKKKIMKNFLLIYTLFDLLNTINAHYEFPNWLTVVDKKQFTVTGWECTFLLWKHTNALNHTRWWVALEQAQQLDRQPWSSNKVVCVVLQVDGRRSHDLDKQEQDTHQKPDFILEFVFLKLHTDTHPAEPGHSQ